MWKAICLLSTALLTTHGLFSVLPSMTPARWFYVLRGAEGALLWLMPLLLVAAKPTRAQTICLLLLAVLGSTFEALTAVCGLAFYWGKGPSPAPAGAMCDAAHPQLMAWVTVAACSALIALTIRR